MEAYRISREFKVVVADVSILLSNARLWMNQFELTLRASTSKNAPQQERSFLERVTPRFFGTFNSQLEQFEELSSRIDPELRGAHQNHVWREWHSVFLSTPFGHRTFYKPPGYAVEY